VDAHVQERPDLGRLIADAGECTTKRGPRKRALFFCASSFRERMAAPMPQAERRMAASGISGGRPVRERFSSTAFWPIAEESPDAGVSGEARSAPADFLRSGETMKILLVEDSRAMAAVMSVRLASFG